MDCRYLLRFCCRFKSKFRSILVVWTCLEICSRYLQSIFNRAESQPRSVCDNDRLSKPPPEARVAALPYVKCLIRHDGQTWGRGPCHLDALRKVSLPNKRRSRQLRHSVLSFTQSRSHITCFVTFIVVFLINFLGKLSRSVAHARALALSHA